MALSLTWVASSGIQTIFSRTEAHYILLKNYDGFTFTPCTDQTIKGPYQHGTTPTNTDADPRQLSFDVMIQTTPGLSNEDALAEIETLIGDLSRQFNTLGSATGVLIYEKSNGDIYRVYCKAGRSTLDMGIRTATSQKVTIRLTAYDPFFYSGSSHIEYIGPPGAPMFPFSFPWEIGAVPDTAPLTNSGDVDTPVKMVITGPITNPVITNTTTSLSMSLTITMSAGDSFAIDTGLKTATYTPSGEAAVNGQQYIDIASKFWVVTPGANAVTLTCGASSSPAGVSLEYSDKFSGV